MTRRDRSGRHQRQLLIRAANRRLGDVAGFADDGTVWEFLCECGGESCEERVRADRVLLTAAAAAPGAWLVSAAHCLEVPATVVVARDGDAIVLMPAGAARQALA